MPETDIANSVAANSVSPMDAHNEALLSNVHPPEWVNPTPVDRYNLVVIGAGTAGLVTAAGAAGLGAKVALIERHMMGGDCLIVGCVPSKCVISSARIAETIRRAADYGIRGAKHPEVDFGAVMQRMRALRAGISDNDSAQRFSDLGVDVFLGDARFVGPDLIQVGDVQLRFKRAVIATGARAVDPPIPGLADAGYLTNETVFNLTERPARLAVIGGGPIGCELAQAFRRLGCEVVLIHSGDHILNREDGDAADIVQQQFLREQIQLILNAKTTRVEHTNHGKTLHYESAGESGAVTVDEILVGAGRAPNVEGLNLEEVGVDYHPRRGVIVNDQLQTTNPMIYAAGDICMQWKFTHAADAAARIVIQNTLFKGTAKLGALTMPWCTFTDPEIAHVGLYEHDAEQQGVSLTTFTIPLSDVDRAIADGETNGFVKIHTKSGTDTILGATIVAAHAGEMISEITTAIVGGVGLGTLAKTIHPYPTQAEAIKKAADAYNRTKLTPFVKQLFKLWLKWTR